MDIDRQTYEAQMLEHADRQTRSLERIDWIVKASFLIGLAAATLWLILFLAS